MFVAINRYIAFSYYKKLIELDQSFKKITKLIMTTNNQQDEHEMQILSGTSSHRRKMANEFKDENSNFKIAIVVDMWLTGFDVPSLDTIYLDKPLKMHNLMQTIARTNRVYSNDKLNLTKDSGLVVDYIGLFRKLEEALSFYYGKSEKEIIKKRDLKELSTYYIQIINVLYYKFLKEINIDFNIMLENKKLSFKLVGTCSEYLIKMKKQENFVRDTKDVGKNLRNIISILNPIERLKFQFLIIIRSYLINIEVGEFDLDLKNKQITNLIHEVIKYDRTTIINKIKGNTILLSEIIDYINTEDKTKTPNLDLKLKISAAKKLLNETERINIKKTKKLQTMLSELMNKYNQNYISMDELLNGLKGISLEVKNLIENNENEFGYNENENAFYQILFDSLKSKLFYNKKKIKEIMDELLLIINNDEEINERWIYNNSMKRTVRRELKTLLRKHKYPPSIIDETKDEIIEQIEYQMGIR